MLSLKISCISIIIIFHFYFLSLHQGGISTCYSCLVCVSYLVWATLKLRFLSMKISRSRRKWRKSREDFQRWRVFKRKLLSTTCICHVSWNWVYEKFSDPCEASFIFTDNFWMKIIMRMMNLLYNQLSAGANRQSSMKRKWKNIWNIHLK